jgi:ankyrin repeat protein
MILSTNASTHAVQDGDTALSLAAFNGHYTTAEQLLNSGATLEAKNKASGSSLVLGLAACVRIYNCVMKIVFLRNHEQDGNTALMLAAHKARDATVALLLNRGAALEAKNNVSSDREYKICYSLEYTSVMWRAVQGGNTALTFAALNGHNATVGMLLNRGAALDVRDKVSDFRVFLFYRCYL